MQPRSQPIDQQRSAELCVAQSINPPSTAPSVGGLGEGSVCVRVGASVLL